LNLEFNHLFGLLIIDNREVFQPIFGTRTDSIRYKKTHIELMEGMDQLVQRLLNGTEKAWKVGLGRKVLSKYIHTILW
jgi:hypothetical protein